MNPTYPSVSLRKSVYVLLITVACAAIGGRILGVARVYEPYLFRPDPTVDDKRGIWPPASRCGGTDR